MLRVTDADDEDCGRRAEPPGKEGAEADDCSAICSLASSDSDSGERPREARSSVDFERTSSEPDAAFSFSCTIARCIDSLRAEASRSFANSLRSFCSEAARSSSSEILSRCSLGSG